MLTYLEPSRIRQLFLCLWRAVSLSSATVLADSATVLPGRISAP
ncbi:Hypothetical protein MLTONO_p0078 (plasmid) [Mesorhizobium loti]|nr:Hypothetical protein MLTONO_p0078 [Mesorhizobium loti]BCH05097.1 hypothetical protein MesoLj131b_70960 [Mesorhizobium sp. 131-2-5]